jgi:hypothetical protein
MPELFLLFLPDSKTGRKTVVLNAPAMAILAELPRIGAFAIAGESGGDAEEKQRADLKRPWVAVRKHAIHPAREQQSDIERVLAYRRASPVPPFAFCYFLCVPDHQRSVGRRIGPAFLIEGRFTWNHHSTYFLAFALSAIPIGVALDAFGPRLVQGWLMTVAAIGASVFALASATTQFQGMGPSQLRRRSNAVDCKSGLPSRVRMCVDRGRRLSPRRM